MLRDSTALITLLEHATAARDEATAQLYLQLEQLKRVHAQREQLLVYRRDYEARWTTHFRGSAAIEVVQSYQGFVVRLNQALEQLERQSHQAEQQAQEARQRLVERETRVASVKRLLERRAGDERRHFALHEQKDSDELATMKTWQARQALAAVNH